MSPFSNIFIVALVLALLQCLAALPWLATLDLRTFREQTRKLTGWLGFVGATLALALAIAMFIWIVNDSARLRIWGRVFAAILQFQLIIDFFAVAFPVLLLVWPHGGAVALAAFREGIRQPLYWLVVILALFWLVLSPFLPYFTFGEDFKMVRQLGYDTIMLAAVLFAVLAASMSISEEIEGRTAITVMSKPVSRRQFLIGKFLGILLAASSMTLVLGWAFNGVMWYKLVYDAEQVGDPAWLDPIRFLFRAWGDAPVDFCLGIGVWFDNALAASPGLIVGFCQVMVLLAIAVALSTRLPMIVNMVTCLVVFFLGHLTHILVQVSASRFALINFMAKVFDTILPGLEYFDLGPVIVRDVPPDMGWFWVYIGSVCAYATLYSIIALLLGLVLFEDRDLA